MRINIFNWSTSFKKFSGLFLLKIFSSILSIIFLMVITNKFTSDEVGSFFVSFTLLSFLALLSKFGLDIEVSKQITKNEICNNSKKASTLIANSIILILFFSCSALFLLFFLNRYIYKVPNLNVILLLALPFYSLLLFYSTLYKAIDRQYLSILFENIILYLILIIFLFFLSSSKFYFIYNFFLILILFNLFLCVKNFKLKILFTNFFVKIPSKLSLIKNGFFILLPTTLTASYGFFDIIMLNNFAPVSSVSIYSVSSKISLIISFGISILNSLLLPIVPSLLQQRKGKAILFEVFNKIKYVLLFSIPVFLIFILFPRFILGFFGPFYESGNISLIILSIFHIFNVLTGGVTFVLLLSSIKKIVSYVLLISLILNLFLNYFLIPIYFHDGAAFATAFSSIFSCILLFLIYYNYLKRLDKIS
jgi:O-antigen/teichoic acid export membrane protein